MEARALYQTDKPCGSPKGDTIDPNQFVTVQVGISPKWHKILLRLQQLERQGVQISIVQFTRRGPKVLEVIKPED